MDEKEKFAIEQGMFEKEYATYKVKCKGYDEQDEEQSRLISFVMKTNKIVSAGDCKSVKTKEGIANVIITAYEYEELDNTYMEFPQYESAHEFPSCMRRYKKIPLKLSDEEYEKLKAEQEFLQNKKREENKLNSSSLWIQGVRGINWVIFIAIIITGITMGGLTGGGVGFLIFLGSVLVAFFSVAGMMIYLNMVSDIAEIRKILMENKRMECEKNERKN